jgi:DNA-binding NarL/FixJ family response regulator
MIRILVADDQKLIRAGLAAMIKAMPELILVGEAATGDEVVTAAAASVPDVILSDLKLTGQILGAVRESGPKVLVLTTFEVDESVYAAVRAGASGFLLKESKPERLLKAIRAVACGAMLLPPGIVRRIVEIGRAPAPQPKPRLPALTNRESDLLRLVGRGLSNADIASALFLSEATVKSYVARLMSKLALSSRAQAVVIAYETGLVTPRSN